MIDNTIRRIATMVNCPQFMNLWSDETKRAEVCGPIVIKNFSCMNQNPVATVMMPTSSRTIECCDLVLVRSDVTGSLIACN